MVLYFHYYNKKKRQPRQAAVLLIIDEIDLERRVICKAEDIFRLYFVIDPCAQAVQAAYLILDFLTLDILQGEVIYLFEFCL